MRATDRPVGGRITVSTEVTHGQVVPTLVASAADAGMLVLGHHRMSRSHHLPTLSVTHGVAAHATCPVYAVPDDWHELRDHPEPVVAAVEDEQGGPVVAARAFAEARLCGSAVRSARGRAGAAWPRHRARVVPAADRGRGVGGADDRPARRPAAAEPGLGGGAPALRDPGRRARGRGCPA
ncbi:MAG: universal stress protein [Nocardioides sp.]|nr:universal stress protein [Nocardioides sp.]